MGDISRDVALCVVLVFLSGTLIGSLLPESGNVVAAWLRLKPHALNYFFLAIGVIGIGVACYFGYRECK